MVEKSARDDCSHKKKVILLLHFCSYRVLALVTSKPKNMRISKNKMRRWKSFCTILMMLVIIKPLSACSNKLSLDGDMQQTAFFESDQQTVQTKDGVSGMKIDIDRNFKGIDVEMQTFVVFEQSNELSVKVSIPQSMQKKVRIFYEEGCVKVKAKSNASCSDKDGYVKINIKAPRLQSVDLSGASQLYIRSRLQQKDRLELDVSGASSIRCDELAVSSQLEIDLSGASNININSVSCGSISIDQSGASSIKLQKIETGNVSVDLSGASSLLLSGNMKALDTEVSGCSSLKLKGRAGKVVLGVSGASKVDCKELDCSNSKESISGSSKIIH